MPADHQCTSLQQCQKKTRFWPGAWRLAPQRAISLLPHEPSQILIVQGCAWITWEVEAGHSPSAGLDRFLRAGDGLDVPAGVRLVMESLDPHQPVDFDWRVMPAGLSHRPLHARPPLTLLVRQWWLAWLSLGQASAQLLRGLARQKPSAQPQPPGSVA